jgi:hypothetical protein
VRPPVHILGSYFFFRTRNLVEDMAGAGPVDFLADSGAFSAFNSGKMIELSDYANWLRDNASVINCAATLDVIGDPASTARNTEKLMSLVDGAVPILPVFHVNSPWPILEQLCRDHPYVMLGGAVALSGRGNTEAMLRWCVRAHKIAREHNTRLHGLGLTRPPYGEALPWYSIDSSYWTSASRTGTISLFDGRKMVKFRVGRPGAADHAALIRAYGGDPKRAVLPGFGLVRESGPMGRRDRDWLSDASILAWRRYETWLRARRPLVPPPRAGRVTGTGPKVYLAAGSVENLRRIIRVIRAYERPTDPTS